jgi:phosphoserine phosphatase RsbU/P
MFDFAEYDNTSLTLPDNFTFTLFSDGILEIMPEKNLKLQLEDLKKLVNDNHSDLNKAVDKLVTDSDVPILDDITLLSLKKGKI